MDTSLKQYRLLPRIKATIERVAPDAEIILYGSVARGEAVEDSDIDLLIVVDQEKISFKEETAITYPLYDIDLEENVIISPRVYTRKDWYGRPFHTPFYINVMNEGIRL